MTFDDITGDRKLWAVHFEGEDDNELYKVFNNWADVVWLRAFFKENIDDLNAYFKITDIKEAISDTIEDSERLRYIIMDISPETDLSKIFRPLDNNQASDVMLQKEKARSLVMAPAIRYQIDSRQLHHHRRRHQADGYDAGKRAHQAGTCENRQSPTLPAGRRNY